MLLFSFILLYPFPFPPLSKHLYHPFSFLHSLFSSFPSSLLSIYLFSSFPSLAFPLPCVSLFLPVFFSSFLLYLSILPFLILSYIFRPCSLSSFYLSFISSFLFFPSCLSTNFPSFLCHLPIFSFLSSFPSCFSTFFISSFPPSCLSCSGHSARCV